jgi:hypothetical protein
MSDQTKPTEQDADAARKRRREELMAQLASNPRFKIRSGTGEAFITPMPGGAPKPPESGPA